MVGIRVTMVECKECVREELSMIPPVLLGADAACRRLKIIKDVIVLVGIYRSLEGANPYHAINCRYTRKWEHWSRRGGVGLLRDLEGSLNKRKDVQLV